MSEEFNEHHIRESDDLIEYCPESPVTNEVLPVSYKPEESKEIPTFQCEECSYIGISAANIRRHKANTHDGWAICQKGPVIETVVIYVCSLCHRQYACVEDLKGHMIEYHKLRPATIQATNDKPHQTETSSKKPITLEQGNSHTFPQLRPVPFKYFKLLLRNNMMLRCPIPGCIYKFETNSKLEAHAKCHKKTGVYDFKCTDCGIEFTNWRRCSKHLWKAHDIDVDLMQCPLCTFRAAASVLVWRHMRNHKKWRALVLKSLKAAREKQTSAGVVKQLLPEDECSTPIKVPLPESKSKYYAEKTCDICNRTFANGKTLSKHVKTVHNKIKPFICNICGKKVARKATLIVHLRQHTGEKPFQCNSCKFTARDPSVLRKHQMRHEKPQLRKHKCISCNRTFIQTSSLKYHIRIRHPDEFKKISCELCSYVTINAEKLTAHKDDHRKGLIVKYEDSLDATRSNPLKNSPKLHEKHLTNAEISSDCFLPLESVDSIPHEPAVDTGGVTIPANSEDTQFPTFLNN